MAINSEKPLKNGPVDRDVSNIRKKPKPSAFMVFVYIVLAVAGVYFLTALMIYLMLYAGRPGDAPFTAIFGFSAAVFPVIIILSLLGVFKK